MELFIPSIIHTTCYGLDQGSKNHYSWIRDYAMYKL